MTGEDDPGKSSLKIHRQIQQVNSAYRSKVLGLRHLPSRVRKVTQRLRNFGYEPLENPSDQIRLLKFRPRGIREPITVDISTWSRSEAPPYYAISYTWGEKRMRKMYINGCPIDVRQNCFYALWQAQLRHRNDYVWIDCLCIDQGNDQEKSEQVAMMYEIYKAAARVLVCIGPAGEGSDYLTAFGGLITRLRLPANPTGDVRWGKEFRALLHLVDYVLDQYKDIHALHRTICAVSQLRYWNRLWVMQEIIASDLKFELLYGSNVISYPILVTFMNSCNSCGNIPFCALELSRDFYALIQTHLGSWAGHWSVNKAIVNSWMLECADPRDHIYGTFSLLDKMQGGWELMRPDYTKPLWDLVLEVAPHVEFENFDRMIAAFGTDCYYANVKEVLSEQRILRETSELSKIPLANICQWELSLCYVSRIVRDSKDSTRLKVDLLVEDVLREEKATGIKEFISRLNMACEDVGGNLRQPHLQGLWDQNHLAALVTADVQEGDILATLYAHSAPETNYLVLRHVSNDAFAIMGQGVGVNGRKSGSTLSRVHTTLNLTPEEAVVLAAQDLKAEPYRRNTFSREAVDETARLLRVVTNPKLSPGIGATVRWDCKNQRARCMGEPFDEGCDCDSCSKVREKTRNEAWGQARREAKGEAEKEAEREGKKR